MKRVGLFSIIIALVGLVLSFQACEPSDGNGGPYTGISVGDGNGGPYTGIQVVAPDQVESGVAFTVRVNSSYDTVQFRIAQGTAWIADRIDSNSVLIETAADYLGSIFVDILVQSQVVETIEIRVVSPQTVDIGARHSSFGYPMVVSDNLIFVSAQRAPNESFAKAGQVLVFDNSSLEPQLIQTISNPSTDETRLYYGQNLAVYQRKLFISSALYNQVDVYEFNLGSGRFERVRTLAPQGETRYGCKILVHGNRLYVGSYGGGSTGKIYIYDIDQGFSLEEILSAPANYREFGRNFDISNDQLFVNSYRFEASDQDAGPERRYGAMHVYDLPTLEIEQSIVHYSDKSIHWGKVFLAHDDFLFIKYREQDENDGTWRRHIDVYQRSSGANGQYTRFHALNDPQGSDIDHHFARSMVADGNRLFVGAPKGDTPQATNSGVVHIFDKDPSSEQWKYSGLIGPNYDLHEVVRVMGLGLYIHDAELFISLRGSKFGESSLPGQMYKLPIDKPNASNLLIETDGN